MKVIYIGKDKLKRDSFIKEDDDILLLGFDRWDDYDYKTTFPTVCKIKGEIVETGSIKILIAGQKVSYEYLDNLLKEGWNGEFPIPEKEYISVPSAITFYEQIDGRLGHQLALKTAEILRDASLKVWIEDDKNSIEFIKNEGFRTSLLRERGANSAYHNAWKLFSEASIIVKDLRFNFRDPENKLQTLNLKFNSKSLLPQDIHVLIGPNGVGKSQTLMQMIEDWLDIRVTDKTDVGFEDDININQLVVVSYSPFERFPIDTKNLHNSSGKIQDEGIYRYFGLRGRQTIYDKSGSPTSKIRLSQSRPKIDASNSLISCLADDQKYGAIKDWSDKVSTMQKVLRSAIDFDYAAVSVHDNSIVTKFFDESELDYLDKEIDDVVVKISPKSNKTRQTSNILIPISSDLVNTYNIEALKDKLVPGKGVVFLKNGIPIELSSGQRLFSYVVINILGAIRRNSLILIDEPEIFLHPTLEIAFIKMLKKILSSYHSKALLATHSLVAVRELPKNCVHVFDKTKDGLFIKSPPFETFGGDMQKISSYVFGDKSVSKPFEKWIKEKLEEFGSAEALINALGTNINEEMIIQISAMGTKKW